MKYIVTLLITASATYCCSAEPMILLMNAQPKCMSVEAPADTKLNIDYEAPDLITADSKRGPDGQPVDPRSFRKYRTTITIEQDDERGYHHGRHDPRKPRDRNNGKVVKDLEQKKGSIIFDSQYDGKISICIQSLTASSISPTPISIRVYESPDMEGFEITGSGAQATSSENKVELDSQSQRNAKEHFSQMEKTLSSLISKTDMILRQADYAKELEVEFHDQTIAMNKASQWWPIVQLCVLLVTGFTQANHMISFFRKHHIY